MFATLRHRNFALLWFGQLISMIGDWVLFIALPVYVYEITGSALASGTMFIVESLPSVLLGSVAGVFADRWDRRRTLIVADLMRAAVILLLLLLRSAEWLWVVYVVALLETTISQFFFPAKDALVPRLVGEEHLLAANSVTALSNNVSRLIGPSLGGLLLGLLGLQAVILVDSASFLISGILIASIVLPRREGERQQEKPRAPLRIANIWGEWLEGLRVVKGARIVAAIFVVMGTVAIGEGILIVLLVPFIEKVLHGGALEFGAMASAQAIGSIIGGMFIGKVSGRIPPTRLIALGGLINGFILLGIFNLGSLQMALALFLIAGIPIVGAMVSLNTLLQGGVPDEFRGRVFGAFGTTIAVLSLFGRIIASAFGDRVGIVTLLNFDAALYILAGILAFLMMRQAGVRAPILAKSTPLV